MDGCPLFVLKEQGRREVYIVVAGEGGSGGRWGGGKWRPLKTR